MRIVGWLKQFLVVVAVVVLTIFGLRVFDSQRGPPLARWHTFVPRELSAKQLDSAAWTDYLRAEDRLFASVKAHVSDRLKPRDCISANRYCSRSPVYSAGFQHNWNRSFVLDPYGAPAGAVVLLHGLTDSPYSVRHIAELYRAHGWLALAIRLPGHGTVPAGLTEVTSEQWRAATRLAVREARRRVGPDKPLHIVGYSNGAALAIDYALSALGDKQLARVDRLVLLSPSIGIGGGARFAGVAGWPAVFPAFAKAAWLDVLPEFNPYKYNSFPVNAARESYAMTQIVQVQLDAHAADHTLASLPPILAFQSLVDWTIDMPSVVTGLYDKLPANGSELVLFDLNHSAIFAPLLKPDATPPLARLLPPLPRKYAVTVVSNDGRGENVAAHSTLAGKTTTTTTPLGLPWPAQVYSVGHIALPYPLDDGLYGLTPDPSDDAGIRLGSLAVRGETDVLIVPPSLLTRISANPFFPFMATKIEAAMPPR
jgi:alpha-beta hydrolase superfamily lysophospholipase